MMNLVPCLAIVLLLCGRVVTQPQGEAPVDLRARIAGLATGTAAQRLATIRGLGLHRHLFAPPNRKLALAALNRLLIHADREVAQAAATVFYLQRDGRLHVQPDWPGPKPGGPRGRAAPDWQEVWALGLHDKLDAGGRKRLIGALGEDDPLTRTWAVFALARHRSANPDVVPHLLTVLRRGGEDQRALAARQLAGHAPERGAALLPAILAACAAAPRDLRAHYVRSIAALPWTVEEHRDVALRLLCDGLGGAELEPLTKVTAALVTMPVADAGLALLEVLSHRDDTVTGSFRDYAALDLRRRAAVRLAQAPPSLDRFILPRLDRLLRDPAPHPAALELIRSLGPRVRSLWPRLLDRIDAPHWRSRERAARLLAEWSDAHGGVDDASFARLQAALRRRAEGDSADFRRDLALALAVPGPRGEAIAGELLKWNDAGDSCGFAALGRVAAGSDAVLDLLLREPAAGELSRKARIGRLRALGRTGRRSHAGVARRLVRGLDTPDTRIVAIQEIQRLRPADPAIVARLTGFLAVRDRGQDTDLYSAACLATLNKARAAAMPVLLRLMDTTGRESAMGRIPLQAIAAILEYPALDEEVLLRVAGKMQDARTTAFIAEKLGALGPGAAVTFPALLQRLRLAGPRDRQVLRAILIAWGRIGVHADVAVPILLDYASQDAYLATPARASIREFGDRAIPALRRAAAGEDPGRARRASAILRTLAPR